MKRGLLIFFVTLILSSTVFGASICDRLGQEFGTRGDDFVQICKAMEENGASGDTGLKCDDSPYSSRVLCKWETVSVGVTSGDYDSLVGIINNNAKYGDASPSFSESDDITKASFDRHDSINSYPPRTDTYGVAYFICKEGPGVSASNRKYNCRGDECYVMVSVQAYKSTTASNSQMEGNHMNADTLSSSILNRFIDAGLCVTEEEEEDPMKYGCMNGILVDGECKTLMTKPLCDEMGGVFKDNKCYTDEDKLEEEEDIDYEDDFDYETPGEPFEECPEGYEPQGDACVYVGEKTKKVTISPKRVDAYANGEDTYTFKVSIIDEETGEPVSGEKVSIRVYDETNRVPNTGSISPSSTTTSSDGTASFTYTVPNAFDEKKMEEYMISIQALHENGNPMAYVYLTDGSPILSVSANPRTVSDDDIESEISFITLNIDDKDSSRWSYEITSDMGFLATGHGKKNPVNKIKGEISDTELRFRWIRPDDKIEQRKGEDTLNKDSIKALDSYQKALIKDKLYSKLPPGIDLGAKYVDFISEVDGSTQHMINSYDRLKSGAFSRTETILNMMDFVAEGIQVTVASKMLFKDTLNVADDLKNAKPEDMVEWAKDYKENFFSGDDSLGPGMAERSLTTQSAKEGADYETLHHIKMLGDSATKIIDLKEKVASDNRYIDELMTNKNKLKELGIDDDMKIPKKQNFMEVVMGKMGAEINYGVDKFQAFVRYWADLEHEAALDTIRMPVTITIKVTDEQGFSTTKTFMLYYVYHYSPVIHFDRINNPNAG